MLNSILNLDIEVSSFITRFIPHNLLFDYFFSFLSLRDNSIFIWIIIVAVLFFIEEKKDKKFIVYFVISFLLTSFLVNSILKPTFHRQRPVPDTIFTHSSCPTNYSFPSGHAAAAFASATILAAFDKKRKYTYYGF